MPETETKRTVFTDLAPAALVEAAVARGEGRLSDSGALDALTGARTGRSPKDKYTVRDAGTEADVDWSANQPMTPEAFASLRARAKAHLAARDAFVVHASACADPEHALPVRVECEFAWHALFARCLFRRPAADAHEPGWEILAAPTLVLDPARDGTKSEVAVAIDFASRSVVVAGTQYAGEIKKSVFTVLNRLLPRRGVFPMHCSANLGPGGESALFFGLSGTGKTTLSADPGRRLIGDDEHAWSDAGVFNLEGGCYAKTIRLSPEGEPQIYNAIRFGAVLENVPLDDATRVPDYMSQRWTENTRAAYPLDHIPGCEPTSRGGHPAKVVFLTCDAFGVLPPVAKLTTPQALYHFLSGYTAKVAGTEAGVTEPEATFSTCFAAPFLPLRPTRYAELLRERLERYKVPVWLVNTGWTGGPVGVGRRMPLAQTRAILAASLTGGLTDFGPPDPVFGLSAPRGCPGVPAEVLEPRRAWADPSAYDDAARRVAALFRRNFERHAATASEDVRAAGPGA